MLGCLLFALSLLLCCCPDAQIDVAERRLFKVAWRLLAKEVKPFIPGVVKLAVCLELAVALISGGTEALTNMNLSIVA